MEHPTRGYRHLISTLFGVALMLVLGSPSVARATIITHDFEQARTVVGAPLIDLYNYRDASHWTVASEADLALGTLSPEATLDLQTAGGTAFDGVTLRPIGSPGTSAPSATAWWQTDWEQRQCLDIDHNAANAQTVSEYQVRVDISLDDLLAQGYAQANYGDLRAIANDGTTILPIWVDPVDHTLWVKVDQIAAGQTQTVCIYYDNVAGAQTAPANYGETSVFTYATPKPIYYSVYTRYGAGMPLKVSAYNDNTEFRLDGGPLIQLDNAELVTVDGVTSSSVLHTTGPLSGAVELNGFDTIVPISWASTRHLAPSERSANQRLSLYSPFGNATVEIFDGPIATPIDTISIPAQTAVWLEPPGDVINNNSIVIESDLPILVFHDYTPGNDTFVAIPFLDDEWFGVGSTRAHYGASKDGTQIDEYRSDSAAILNRQVNRGAHVQTGNLGSQGGGSAAGLRLVLDVSATPDPQISPPDAQFAAISQADSDGLESTSFFPANELNSRYHVPADTQYMAFSCPTPGTQIVIEEPGVAPSTITCSGVDTVGWVKQRTNRDIQNSTTAGGVTTPGQAIEVHSPSGEPFFMYYETRVANDEANVLGMKQGRQYTWPEPVISVSKEGLFPTSGTWTSADFNVPAGTRVFGQLSSTSTTPAGTTATTQLASGSTAAPANFVGPDGTATSAYGDLASQSVIDYDHDGDTAARVRVTLTTTDRTRTPTFSGFNLSYNLQRLTRVVGAPFSVSIPAPGSGTQVAQAPLLRVRSTNPASAASLLGLVNGSSSGLASYAVVLRNGAQGISSVQLSEAGSVLDPQPFGPSAAYTVEVQGELSVAGTPAALSWSTSLQLGNSNVRAESDLQVSIS